MKPCSGDEARVVMMQVPRQRATLSSLLQSNSLDKELTMSGVKAKTRGVMTRIPGEVAAEALAEVVVMVAAAAETAVVVSTLEIGSRYLYILPCIINCI